jgi:hypothetical protein
VISPAVLGFLILYKVTINQFLSKPVKAPQMTRVVVGRFLTSFC